MKIKVPICNSCGKPHFGRKNVEERCICDSSGDWHEGEIEEESCTEQPADWEEKIEFKDIEWKGFKTNTDKGSRDHGCVFYTYTKNDLKQFISTQIALARKEGAEVERGRIFDELPVLKNTVNINKITKGGRERLRIFKKGFDFAISLLRNKLT